MEPPTPNSTVTSTWGKTPPLLPSFTYGDPLSLRHSIRHTLCRVGCIDVITDTILPRHPKRNSSRHRPGALPELPILKRGMRRHRTTALNPAALGAIHHPHANAQPDVTLKLFNAEPRTPDLGQPREHPKRMKVWHGRLRGEVGSDVTLVAHARANAHERATGAIGVFAYSYGHRDVAGRFRTIMAYNRPTSCPRVKYFSNPRILYNGRPLGVDHAIDPTHSADNTRSMNELR